MPLRPTSLLSAGLAVLSLAIAGPAFADGDLSGTWTLMNYKATAVYPAAQRIPQTLEGGPPAMLPWARDLYNQRIADSDKGRPFAPSNLSCLPMCMPLMMMAANYPIQVIQTPKQVTMLFEETRVFRVIRMNEQHLPEAENFGFLGDSIGRWEGDTLVVDTTGFNDRTSIDLTGMPHTDAMHLVEHFKRLPDGTLEDLITVDDPKTFTKPWTTRTLYRPSGERIMEYFLCENNRNPPAADGHTAFIGPQAGAKR